MQYIFYVDDVSDFVLVRNITYLLRSGCLRNPILIPLNCSIVIFYTRTTKKDFWRYYVEFAHVEHQRISPPTAHPFPLELPVDNFNSDKLMNYFIYTLHILLLLATNQLPVQKLHLLKLYKAFKKTYKYTLYTV